MSATNGTNADEQPIVRMRTRQPLSEQQNNDTAFSAIQRGMESLAEVETTEETEEIKKLNSQMDHLNDYMNKVEQRLKAHNEKLMETLEQQKQERARRRASFHERMQTNHAEDNDFSRQMAEIMNRVSQVNMNRGNRTSVYDFINSGKQ